MCPTKTVVAFFEKDLLSRSSESDVSAKSNSGVTERQDNLTTASYKSDYVRPREERITTP